jgi:hypothetical protein
MSALFPAERSTSGSAEMEDDEAWLKDSLARAVKVLSKAGQSSRVIRGVEEAFRRAQSMLGLEEILAEVRAENERLSQEVKRLVLEVVQLRGELTDGRNREGGS